MKPQRYKLAEVEEAIKGTGGIVLAIANKLKCETETVYNYFKRYPSLEKVRLAEKEKLIDRAEAKLQELINNGEQSAIFFFLKCQAKHRGYIERTESVVAGSIHVGGKIELTQEQDKRLTEEAFASVISRRNVLANAN